jgi:RNA polymerase sigma factor (sigma-70 family)
MAKLRLRAKIYIRNDEMIAAREAKGWNQLDLADVSGVSVYWIRNLESLQYLPSLREETVVDLAAALEIPPSQIAPPDLMGEKMVSKYVFKEDVSTEKLKAFAAANTKRLIMPSGEEIVEKEEMGQEIKKELAKVIGKLTFREQEVLKLRYGLGESGLCHSLTEVAQAVKVSRERARQIENVAIRKIQQPWNSNKLKELIVETEELTLR